MKEGDLVRHKHSKWLAIVHRIDPKGLWVQTFDGHVMCSQPFCLEVLNEGR